MSLQSVQADELWPSGAPGALKDGGPEIFDKGDISFVRNTHVPTLETWLAPKGKANGTAVVICPGGGYGGVAIDHEGWQVAEWLNSFGVAGFVLKYRASPYKHPIPLMDAQRAIRTVRSRAASCRLDPARIGILGFSAGGHLASTAATHFDSGNPNAQDPVERASSRPDLLILGYPVVSFKDDIGHLGSRDNLLGRNPSPELVTLLSNELQVTSRTPPTFLFHSKDDGGVKFENSVRFHEALRKAGVPSEILLLATGGHGYGLGKQGEETGTWPSACERWMRRMGLAG
jgi:acetyl esterase/lipase